MTIKRVTVNLPEEQIQFLKNIAEQEDLTFTDVLRRSINSERFFFEQKIKGNKVLIEDANHQIREVLRH